MPWTLTPVFILIALVTLPNLAFGNVGCVSLFEGGEWKLIRDRLPEIYERENDPQIVRRALPSELRDLLIKKLGEETAEFAENPSAEEMADILEVVEALQRHFGLDRTEIEKIQREKRDQKGAFEEGFVLKLRPRQDKN